MGDTNGSTNSIDAVRERLHHEAQHVAEARERTRRLQTPPSRRRRRVLNRDVLVILAVAVLVLAVVAKLVASYRHYRPSTRIRQSSSDTPLLIGPPPVRRAASPDVEPTPVPLTPSVRATK